MEGVLINDHYMINTRRNVDRRPATNADRFTNLYSSVSSLSQHMMSMDPNQANIAHNHIPQLMRPLYSSLPPSLTSQTSNNIQLPPLLPLPNSSFKFNSMPAFATNKKTKNYINNTNNGARRKKLSKPLISSKSPPPIATTKSISKDTTTNKKEIPKVSKLVQKTSSSSSEDFEDRTIYPLSPPPSSLPLPSLALMRHRVANATVSCTAESVGGVNGDGAVKTGSCCTARDDLLRLLCL